jgi:hypothetical protein
MNWTPPEKPPFSEHMRRMGPAVQDTPWERVLYAARQTGRTHRMIEKAMALRAKGKRVYILVPYIRYGDDLRRTYNLPEDIQIETSTSLNEDLIDWKNMRPSHSAWPNTVLLVDPSYFEVIHRDMLREYHAYDFIPKEQP